MGSTRAKGLHLLKDFQTNTLVIVLVQCIEMTCMMACFDQKSCMNYHSPQNTTTQTTTVALL